MTRCRTAQYRNHRCFDTCLWATTMTGAPGQKNLRRCTQTREASEQGATSAYGKFLAGVYCELREQACKQIFVRELQALRRLTHVGYYEAMAARPRVLTKACWARDCCEST